MIEAAPSGLNSRLSRVSVAATVGCGNGGVAHRAFTRYKEVISHIFEARHFLSPDGQSIATDTAALAIADFGTVQCADIPDRAGF